MLCKLCKAEKIHRIVKGQYVLPEDMQDELLSISRRKFCSLLRSGAHHLRYDPQPQQNRDGDISIGAEAVRRQSQKGFEPAG